MRSSHTDTNRSIERYQDRYLEGIFSQELFMVFHDDVVKNVDDFDVCAM